MRGYQTINTSIFAFCFAFIANRLSAQNTFKNWLQYQEQPRELNTQLRYNPSCRIETSIITQKLITGTDLNALNVHALRHAKHSYGLNIKYFGSPDFQTIEGNLGYLWHNQNFNVAICSKWEKSTESAWEFSPAVSVLYPTSKKSKLSAHYQHQESMGLGYHWFLSKGGIFNLNYSIFTQSISVHSHRVSCSFYYPTTNKLWVGIESHPQQRYNQMTLLYKASNLMNTAIQSGYFSSFKTFHLSFYAGFTLP